MAGMLKRKYFSETQAFKREFTRPLSQISAALPSEYTEQTIIDLYKYYFPLGWIRLNKRYESYKKKDSFLQNVGKKARYFHEEPIAFLLNLPKAKHLLSAGVRKTHKSEFSHERRMLAINALEEQRNKNTNSHNEKSRNARTLVQAIEPLHIDIFIYAYHKKGSTTQDKVEIFNELKKYECEKSIQFFHKLNDSERNDQIRRMAFSHLQKMGEFVKLRKRFKGKSKSYMTEREAFDVTPKDLADRIERNSIQSQKAYDVFISHSYLDSKLVISIKNELNSKNISVYCDWTNDNDFLKRDLASEYTEVVLKKRIEQSKYLLLVITDNSIGQDGEIKSKWVEMEISHAENISKQIYCINLSGGKTRFSALNHMITGKNLSISEFDAEKLRT
ncbi:toll/interleukin-1 receptor domain-containing protein [Chromobacterium sp. IIBBL 290-4]|uniref:toll/interleukin-1 receptor domain-containing protein n=1 Tax=Chromobacterium sp. IIBBL 290-4 TaxID=2953890 RepID=UPI0020B789A5|nr:toll/interleukin-1 receptor domain-containing protein [Chromobacterium sp. IIBBL 290-4]UTH74221.1 toll/interleukin-1 receptor domain-containing protein [Chromobacterium sp. IIBBL 290-4]